MSRFDGGSLRNDAEFTAYYKRWLASLEVGQEASRSSGMRESFIRGLLSLVMTAALAAGMFWFAETWGELGGWLAIVTLGIVLLVLVVWTIDPARTHTLATKDRVTPILVGYFGDFTFKREGTFGLSPFADWNVLDKHNRSKFGDVVTGSFQGVPIRIAELQLSRRYPRRNRPGFEQRPVFSGLFADFVLPEPVETLTLVANENPMWDKHAQERGWNHLDFEAPGYQAYAAGDTDGAYALPEALGNLLDNLRSTFSAKHVLAAFGDSRLVILLEGARNAFEPVVKVQVDLFDEAEAIRQQLGSLARVVEVLDIGPSTEVRDEPRPVDEEALEKKAGAHGDDFAGLGCLPMMILSTGSFLLYGWILNDAEHLTWAFAFSLIASPTLASALLKLNEMRTKKNAEGLVSQIMKIAFAIVPVYFLLQGA